MKKLFSLWVILFFASAAFAQSSSKEPSDNKTPTKIYRGEENLAQTFDSYKAKYRIKTHQGNANIIPFESRTDVIEDDELWVETYRVFLPSDNELLQVIGSISEIDNKTGLLRKFTVKYARTIGEFVIGDNEIVLNKTVDGKIEKIIFDNKEKIYPCDFSTAFYRLLPLAENFSGSFVCFSPELQEKPKLSFFKLTLAVAKTEKLKIEQTETECYKLDARIERIKDAKGKISKPDNASGLAVSFFDLQDFKNSTIWISKKTHQIVKTEVNSNSGLVTFELEN